MVQTLEAPEDVLRTPRNQGCDLPRIEEAMAPNMAKNLLVTEGQLKIQIRRIAPKARASLHRIILSRLREPGAQLHFNHSTWSGVFFTASCDQPVASALAV